MQKTPNNLQKKKQLKKTQTLLEQLSEFNKFAGFKIYKKI